MRYINLLCALMAALSTTSHSYAQQPVNVQDSLALVDFYNSTNGPGWDFNNGWLEGPVNTWYGVRVTDGRVTSLGFPENNVRGSIPASFGNLTELKILNFFEDHLTSLPSSFGNLTKLEFLDLESNQLSSLPESIGNLTQLKKLSLFGNQLSALPETFGNLTNLENLDLAINQLSSLPQSFGSLTKLNTLYLLQNHLSSLPESFGNLTELQVLYLGHNQLTSLPDFIGNLSNLRFLSLTGNQLSSLPQSFGKLTNLEGIGLGFNQLTSLPDFIGNLINLQGLAFTNNQLSSLPESLGNLTNLQTLDLRNNQLSSLPASFGNLTSLQELLLNNNQLVSLPEGIGSFTNLNRLVVSGNQLASLPESLGKLTNMWSLDLSNNQLSSLPESFANLISMINPKGQLYLNDNKFTFAELEWIVKSIPTPFFHLSYAPQDTFKLEKKGNTLIAAVGGTPENNTFYWYRDGRRLVASIPADSTYTPTKSGNYRVEVTNAVVTQWRLISDVVAFAPGNITLTCPRDTIVTTDSSLCTAVVSGIDAVVTGATIADVSYTLSGATTGSGTGTASGRAFNNGLTTVTYTLSSDAAVNCAFTVMVEDKEAPLITTVSATPSVLWPANHKLQDVVVNYNVPDNCGSTIELSVSGNDGATNDDWQVVDDHHVQLRAERSGRGEGRTYVITIMATDASGNKGSQSVNVVVPHDRSKKFNNDLQVLVLPNPSRNDFTLRVQSSTDLPVLVRVSNALGETIETIQNTTTKGTLRLGSNYPAGAYYAEVVQGSSRTVVKLLKLAQ
jgi:Leucine-rich repeat (LRR) protein